MGERRSTKVMQPNKMWVAWLAPAFEPLLGPINLIWVGGEFHGGLSDRQFI
jgi:hypothetical protein